MLHLVRNNSPYTAILLFIFTLCLQLQALMHPLLPVALPSQLLYGWVLYFFSFVLGKSAFGFGLVAVFLIYTQALLLHAIAAKHRLYKHNTFLVSFAYVALATLHPSFGQFSPMLLVNFFILYILNELLVLKQTYKANKHIFNIGFALMLAVLLQFSAIFLVAFALAALLILRPFNFREWMIMLVGLLMPIYILWVLLFCADKLSLMHLWPDLGLSLPSRLKPAKYYLGVFSGLIIWLSISCFNMQSNLPKAPIYIRRCWIAFTILLFICVFSAIFSANPIKGVWVITLPALSLILAHGFINERSKKMNTISFYFALILIVYCQIFLPL